MRMTRFILHFESAGQLNLTSPAAKVYDYCSTGTHEEDSETLSRLNNIIDIAKIAGKFDETVLFRGENANVRHFTLSIFPYLKDCFLDCQGRV